MAFIQYHELFEKTHAKSIHKHWVHSFLSDLSAQARLAPRSFWTPAPRARRPRTAGIPWRNWWRTRCPEWKCMPLRISATRNMLLGCRNHLFWWEWVRNEFGNTPVQTHLGSEMEMKQQTSILKCFRGGLCRVYLFWSPGKERKSRKNPDARMGSA